MKSQKGITLTSLIIYIIAMLIIVSVLTVITGYVYKGIGINDTKEGFDAKYVRLLAYLSKEANVEGNKVSKGTKEEQHYIIFDNGKGNRTQITYIPANKSIYYNKIKICNDIDGFEVEIIDSVLTIILKQAELSASNSFIFSK